MTDSAKLDEHSVFDWLQIELSAIDLRYRGDPSYEHDAFWLRDRVERLIEEARAAFSSAPTPTEVGEAYAHEFGKSNGDGTYCVVIEKGPRSYADKFAVPDWPITPLYTRPQGVEVKPVTRDDAIAFLETACRNWSKVPKLSEEDIGDVAMELLRFVTKRLSALTRKEAP